MRLPQGIVPEVNIKPIPKDEQRVNIFDEAEAKYWAKRFGCTRVGHESWSNDQERGKGSEGQIGFDSRRLFQVTAYERQRS
jgi:hypothetical protein